MADFDGEYLDGILDDFLEENRSGHLGEEFLVLSGPPAPPTPPLIYPQKFNPGQDVP